MHRSRVQGFVQIHFIGGHIRQLRYVVASADADIAVHLRHFLSRQICHDPDLLFRTVQQHFPLNLRVNIVYKGKTARGIDFLYQLSRQIFCGRTGIIDIYLVPCLYPAGIVYQIFCQRLDSLIHVSFPPSSIFPCFFLRSPQPEDRPGTDSPALHTSECCRSVPGGCSRPSADLSR